MTLGFRQMMLIPSGRLSLLSLHIIAVEKTIATYTPSARALQAAKNAAAERAGLSHILLGIGNPMPNLNPLPFAHAEVEEIIPLFDSKAQSVLYEHQATRAETLKNLAGAIHCTLLVTGLSMWMSLSALLFASLAIMNLLCATFLMEILTCQHHD